MKNIVTSSLHGPTGTPPLCGLKRLEAMGYTLRSTSVGCWVDGRCGYLVAGYFLTKKEAVDAALIKIDEANVSGSDYIWKLPTARSTA